MRVKKRSGVLSVNPSNNGFNMPLATSSPNHFGGFIQRMLEIKFAGILQRHKLID